MNYYYHCHYLHHKRLLIERSEKTYSKSKKRFSLVHNFGTKYIANYFTITFTLLSPIFTTATEPNCKEVLMFATPFLQKAEPTREPLML